MKWFHALMPREDRFFSLFDRHAATLTLGARSMRSLLNDGDEVPLWCQKVAEHEAAADDITREVMLAVRRTFITPFDRSDILDLISSMDDSIDQMHKTAKTIALFDVRTFRPHMRDMGDIVVRCADLTAEAVPLLRSMRNNAGRLNAIAEEVVKLEEQSDQLYDLGMRSLYLEQGKSDPMAFIVGSEIYDHLEKVVDRFEDVANRISGVLIEHL
jgi:hypothetical protein